MAKKILIADDELDILKVVTFRLSRAGYEILAVTDGLAAVEKAVSWSPDLVLLDLKMPGLNGLEVAARLKADESTRKLPIILMTASTEGAMREKILASGVDGHLIKPFEPEHFFDLVKSLIGDP